MPGPAAPHIASPFDGGGSAPMLLIAPGGQTVYRPVPGTGAAGPVYGQTCCLLEPPPGYGASVRLGANSDCTAPPSGWSARPIPCSGPPPDSGVPMSPPVPPVPTLVPPVSLPPAAPATPMPTITINGQQAICCPCPG